MHSDQTRKYGISESIIQQYDIVGNKGLYMYYGFRDAILSLGHCASSAWPGKKTPKPLLSAKQKQLLQPA